MDNRRINNNHITIHGWMLNELELKGNDLILYALIYGFSQDGRSEFCGTLEYMMAWTRIAEKNVIARLNSLLERNLIIKRDEGPNGNKRCYYKAIVPKNINIEPLTKSKVTTYEMTVDDLQKVSGPLTKSKVTPYESSDNNIIYNINNNIEDNIHIPPIPQNDIFPDVEIVSEYDFEIAWNLYGNIGNEYLSRCEWNMLSLSEKQRALEHIPKYNASISDIRYKKAFQNYLKLKEFTSSIINRNGPTSIRKSEVTDDAIAEIVSRNYKL
jgi:hypothetical protein